MVRLAWHFTTALMLLSAYILFLAATQPAAADARLVIATGVIYLGAGIIDALATRFKHDAWPLLVSVGLLTLLAQT